MKKWIMQAAGWLHATLLLAIVAPAVYAASLDVDVYASFEKTIYWKCLLIVVPVAATGIAIRRCRTLAGYGLSCILVLTVSTAAAWFAGGLQGGGDLPLAYLIFFVAEELWVAVSRLLERIRRNREEQDGGMEEVEKSLFSEPAPFAFFYFAVLYLIGVNIANPYLADEAFFSTILYLFVYLVFRFVKSTEWYLKLNNRVANLPGKRIYGISVRMFASVLCVLGIAIVVAILLIPERTYRDVRKWSFATVPTQEELVIEEDGIAREEDEMADLEEIFGTSEPPWWLDWLYYAVEAAAVVFLGILFVKAICRVFRDFGDVPEENGDVFEKLENPSEVREKLKERRLRPEAENAVRKKYRRMIKKHSGGMPNPCATPSELELAAGIRADADMTGLHDAYESVRYRER